MEVEDDVAMNMEDFMDVVMAYKCKFCSITCCTPQQMATHIKADHVVTTISQNPKKLNDDLLNNCPAVALAQDKSSAIVAAPEEASLHIELVSNSINNHMQTINTDAPVDLLHPNERNRIGEGELYTLTSQSSVNGNVQLNTKLLYVCGQCSVGFNSIEDCKEHMLASHGQSENVEEEPSENTLSQVSVGTQMEPKKKPGRKRKTEVKVEVVSSEESEAEDRDWLPENRTGRSRRKIRPPQALKEDYYIGKKKKNKRQRAVNEKSFTHKCHLYGCMAKFKSKENLDIHVSCHNTSNESFTCPQCQIPFLTWRILRIHLHRKHSIDLDLVTCEICNFKIDTMNKLRVHKEIHSDCRPYTCDVCGKGFRQYSQMKNHQLVHSQYQKKEQHTPVTCSICSRSFVNKKCLQKHEQTVHCDVKQFKCTVCNYESSRKAMMTLHMRIHTGEKPFKCDLCAYSTGDHNSLRRHKMRHTGQKQYKCSFCPYSCIQAISLKSHLKSKHPGCAGNYFCDHCNFQTVSKSGYDNHIQDHRNGLIVNKPKSRVKSSMITQTDIGENELFNFTEAPEAMQVKMHVQTMKSGEAQVSAEDLAKLSCYEGLMTGEVSAAQLIYSALNAISQSEKTGVPQTAELLGGVQCTTISADCEEGVTSHTITFHLPANFQTVLSQDGGEEGEAILFGQPVEIIETVDESAVQFIEANINDTTGELLEGDVVTMGIVVSDNVGENNQVDATENDSAEDGKSFIVIGHHGTSNEGFQQNLLDSHQLMQATSQEVESTQDVQESEQMTVIQTEELTQTNQQDSNEIMTIDLEQIVQSAN